ncbi:hypothetical protein ACOYX4_13590 [Enterococcus entomosocium]|uniref:hypothetical protein n=1 Tax=Enterococcus entomosocium TaxID=3034352 RepID=UPI003BB9ABC8
MNEKEVTISFKKSEILNLMDWFNGYVSKYYGSDPVDIKDNLPEIHKNLIDKILEKYEEFPVFLSKEEIEMLGLRQGEE